MNKKALLMAVLALAVVTTLTAGTLAIYTTQTTLEANDVTAKRFVVEAGMAEDGEFQPKIAPMETAVYQFDVTNANDGAVSEVDTALRIYVAYKNGNGRMDGYRMTLVEYDDASRKSYTELAEHRDNRVFSNDNLTWDSTVNLPANTAVTRYFGVLLKWDEFDPAGNSADLNAKKNDEWDARQGRYTRNLGTVKVTVTGTQVIEGA